MKIDKRIVGLALVSVILSTLIMLTIARERIDQPIEILKNDYPMLLEENRKGTFSFAMVTRKKFENVQIRFSVLSQQTLKYGEMLDPKRKFNTSDTAEDVLGNVVKVGWMRNQTGPLGIEPEEYDYTLVLGGVPNRLLIYDYSNILESLSGRESAVGTALTYAAMIDENGEAYYFEGGSDFFFSPSEDIISLSTSHNADERNFLPDDQIWNGSNRLPLSEAPIGGILDFKGVDKDDTFTVIFTVEPEEIPGASGSAPPPNRKDVAMLQLVRVYLDGEVFDPPIVNAVKGRRR